MEPRRGHLCNGLLGISVLISLSDKLMKAMVFNNLSDQNTEFN